MRIKLIAVGSRMPRWVEDGWQEYAKRMPSELSLELVEIPLTTRGKNADVTRMIRQEGEAMLAKVAPGNALSPWKSKGGLGAPSNWRLSWINGVWMRAPSTLWWVARKGWRLRCRRAVNSAGRCRR